MLVFKQIPEELDAFEGEVVISIVGTDERPLKSSNAWLDWRLYGTLSQLVVRKVFSGDLEEKCLIPTYSRFQFDRLILLGGGELFSELHRPDALDGESLWKKITYSLEQTVESLRVKRIGLSLPRFQSAEAERALLKILQGSSLPNNTSLFLSRASHYATPLGL